MLLRRLVSTLLIAFIAANVVGAEEKGVPEEQFAARVPPEWKGVYQYRRADIMLAEFLPVAENVADWSTMLSYEFHAVDVWMDPIEFVDNFAANQAELCEGFRNLNMSSGMENGYPTSVRMLICPKMLASGKGRVTLLKAMRGDRGYYVAALMRRADEFEPEETPVSPDEIAAWSQFMRQIIVCVPGDSEHPCQPSDT
ncbi:MAG: hypothetical protein O7G84_05670 [Gammaproteobacteria bacterium]|nr:hypothetical protein [Gammaproteobacteria bacterium]